MKVYTVYILKCSDSSYYTGITSNISKRLFEHQSGFHPDSYTSSRRPVQLMFTADFTDVGFAIDVEKQIKKWSRAKKEALIDGRFEDLPGLSRKIFKK